MTPSSLIVLLLCIASLCQALPDGWSACKMSDPKYQDCLKNQINNAISSLKNGNKKMGIAPLEPYKVDKMVVKETAGPVTITLEMMNISTTGLSDAKVTEVKNDWKKMSLKLLIPKSRTVGIYKGQGTVLNLPVRGQGDYSFEWVNLQYTFDITFKQITKNGKKYFQAEKMLIGVSGEKFTINLSNLFNGNKQLGDMANQLINDNSALILELIAPAIGSSLEGIYKEYINKIFAQIPAEEIEIK